MLSVLDAFLISMNSLAGIGCGCAQLATKCPLVSRDLSASTFLDGQNVTGNDNKMRQRLSVSRRPAAAALALPGLVLRGES